MSYVFLYGSTGIDLLDKRIPAQRTYVHSPSHLRFIEVSNNWTKEARETNMRFSRAYCR